MIARSQCGFDSSGFCKLLIRGVIYVSLERSIISDYKPRFQHCFDSSSFCKLLVREDLYISLEKRTVSD
jgi:hypothetical protein